VGLGAFFALGGLLAWSARRVGGDRHALGAWSGAAALAAVALVDFPFHRPAEWALFWMFLGILGGSKVAQKEAIGKVGGESSR
jgi:hypothetical protein